MVWEEDVVFFGPELDIYYPRSVILGCNGDWACFFYEWQTLIGAGLALLAALLTVREIRCQIAQSQRQHDEALARRARAARARLNDALSALCRFSVESAQTTLDGRAIDSASFPTGAIAAINDAIEHVDDKTSTSLSELVQHYQVHNARLSEYEPILNDPDDSIFFYIQGF